MGVRVLDIKLEISVIEDIFFGQRVITEFFIYFLRSRAGEIEFGEVDGRFASVVEF